MAKSIRKDEPIEALLKEGRRFPPPKDFTRKARARNARLYQEARRYPVRFWEKQARELDWIKPWKKGLEWKEPFAKWFVGGRLNASTNCLDRHIAGPRRTKAALIWEGEPEGQSRTLTYFDLYREEVTRFAAALRQAGVRKGEIVTIYMPMIPEVAVAILACARIGAPHSVVFGGFSPESLRDRINDAKSRLVITADGGMPARLDRPAQAQRRRGAQGVPDGGARGRGRAHGRQGNPVDRGPGRLVAGLHPARAGALRSRADGRRGHALPPLHLRLHRQAQGHRAHHGRVPHRGERHQPVRLRPA